MTEPPHATVWIASVPAFEKREGVLGLGVLADEHDADVRPCAAKRAGGLQALVAVCRWHPDVGQDDVRVELLDGGKQRVQIGARSDDLEFRAGGEQAPKPLAYQQVVLADRDAKRRPRSSRHGGEIRSGGEHCQGARRASQGATLSRALAPICIGVVAGWASRRRQPTVPRGTV
jgi:hypothetical protein